MSKKLIASGIPETADLNRQKSRGMLPLVIGIIGLVIASFGLFRAIETGDNRYAVSWLIGFAFWFAILVGMLFIVQIWYLFDAGWSAVVRRQIEGALGSFKWLMLLLLPVLLLPWFFGDNMGLVWRWMNPENVVPGIHEGTVGHDALYLHKEGFLNIPFLVIRIVLYFVVFCGLSALLRYFSYRNDREPSPTNWGNCRKVSAIGIFLTAFATTFAAFDLFMSLSYHWFSTMYGVWFFSASMRAGLAATAVLCYYLSTRGSLRGIYNESHAYFLGCLCLAFTVFWAYISFSQYFLIYNANIPEETFWYNIREMNPDGATNSWWWVGLTLIFFYFIIPFLCLLWYRTKVIPKRFLSICLYILFFSIIDLYFNILPAEIPDPGSILGYQVRQFVPNVFDIAAIIGIGGICIWSTLRNLRQHEPIPLNDPRVLESVHSVE